MSDNSCSKFRRYRSRVGGFTHEVSAKEWPRLRAWFLNQGREEFCAAFRQETLIKPNATTDRGARLGAALPNSVADYEKKIADKAYYRAQAEFFLLEMDEVLGRVPADAGAKRRGQSRTYCASSPRCSSTVWFCSSIGDRAGRPQPAPSLRRRRRVRAVGISAECRARALPEWANSNRKRPMARREPIPYKLFERHQAEKRRLSGRGIDAASRVRGASCVVQRGTGRFS